MRAKCSTTPSRLGGITKPSKFRARGVYQPTLNTTRTANTIRKVDRKSTRTPADHVPLRICLLSYRSNPHCGGQGVYLKNLSRALKDLGHAVEVISGPPDPQIDRDIPVFHLPALDLYNPEDPFRVPTLEELMEPINLMEWIGVSTMGFPEPFTFGLRAYLFLRSRLHTYDIVHDNQSLSYGVWAINKKAATIATI
ncbi:MAG: glycosyltransferase, partial [Desulfobacterales bacterium]|nr:glycosyltransferase [Desulfobacterales bacterium]